MSNSVDDKELDEYLSGGTQYSRHYRAIDADAVPADLDALVIANADAESLRPVTTVTEMRSAKVQRKRPLGFWTRASIPIALAASLVVALSIQLDSGVNLNSVSGEHAAARLPQAEPAAELPVEATSVDAAPKIDTPYLNLEKKKAEVESEQRKLEAPLAKRVAAESAAIASSQGVLSTDKFAERQRVDAAQPFDNRAQDAASISSAPASPAPAIVATAPRSETAAKSDVPGAASVAQEARASNAKRTAGDLEFEEIIVTGSRIPGANSNSAAGPRGTIPPSSFSERVPSDAELAKQSREANPGSWLEYIRDLRANGKSRDADREWRRFLKAYPAYSVDEVDTARPKK